MSSESSRSIVIVPVGVVLDRNSPLGSMIDWCSRMAVLDFYSAHPNYQTRFDLHFKNAQNLLDANFAVLDLLNHDEVIGILGPQEETEIAFVTELGKKVDVPVISFTARSSTFSYADNQYPVRTSPDDAIEAQALAAICQGFEWSEVVVLYEDTDYGSHFLSRFNKALHEVEVGIAYMVSIPIPLDNSHLLKELEKLRTKQTRVFVVHISPSLVYDLFSIAKRAGLMSEGCAWIVSDKLSIFMDSLDFVTRHSMEGVLGIRPFIYRSKELENFQQRWKRSMFLEERADSMMELNAYGLWAYDAITALAIAVEKVGPINTTLLNINATKNVTDNKSLRTSKIGPGVLYELSRANFRGLTGDFVNGKLKQSAFEIFNVYGSGERTIGFWTPDRGIIRELNAVDAKTYSTSTKELKSIIWPGDSVTRPKDLAIPGLANLKVGIPMRTGFTTFVTGTIDPTTNHTDASGFAVDIFFSALKVLPFPISYEFQLITVNLSIHSVEDMLHDYLPQKFDMMVGDLTIMASRAAYADFSFPYSESGVVLVVKNRKPFDMWIFIKPLRWDLWLAIIMACILVGMVLRILERRVTMNGEDQSNTHKERLGTGYWSPVTVLAFPERNMVSNNWSLLVLVFWLFMAFILMQSYTANLSAILTVDQLKFAFSDNYYVGCQEGSFVKKLLTEQLHISPANIRSYMTAEEYHHAMTIGSKKGGIDAIFDEIPYMKVFLNKYDSQYKMVGPTYKTGGFGFAFPLHSLLAAPFSKAILNVTQGPEMTAIEQKNFGPGYSSQDPLSSTISQGTSSLTLYEFAGLFLIVGSVTIFALVFSETSTGQKFTEKFKHSLHACFHFKSSNVSGVDGSVNGDVVEGGGEEIQESMQNNVSALIVDGTNALSIEESPQVSGSEIHETCPSDETFEPRGL